MMKINLMMLMGVFFYSHQLFSQNVISGEVKAGGKALSDVVVSNGTDCTKTDEWGRYSLPCYNNERFVFVSTPAGYIVNRDGSLPQFYQPIDTNKHIYNFTLQKNPKNDEHHICFVQADVQVNTLEQLKQYNSVINDFDSNLKKDKSMDIIGLDCGDMTWDNLSLFPKYIEYTDRLNIPFFRAIGNHDMDYHGRSFETSYATFEKHFGPTNYSFNKGKAHYVILNNNFYIGREFYYMGYLDEHTLKWLEQDLQYVPKGSLVIMCMHIPLQLQDPPAPFKYDYTRIGNETVNASGVRKMLEDYNVHFITGHMHYNNNVDYNKHLMEHNTAAVCGTWWLSDICIDGTPRGYAIYDVNGDSIKWYYKSVGHPKEYQFRAYPAGSDKDDPNAIIVNIWNWDNKWKAEWLEDGKLMGSLMQYNGLDPLANDVCNSDIKKVCSWVAAEPTKHLFKFRPCNPNAKITIRVTDRFNNVYTQKVE